MVELYRSALEIRRRHPALGDGSMAWLDRPAGFLLFAREPGFVRVVNVTDGRVPSPCGETAAGSGELTDDGLLPPDTALWLAR